MTSDDVAGRVLQWCIDDQRQRWSVGKPLAIEAYLKKQPALAANPESVLALVYNEFCLRKELGQQPKPAEYIDRFFGPGGQVAGALSRRCGAWFRPRHAPPSDHFARENG